MKTLGFSDLHQHLLWGLDDGARTPEQMHKILKKNAAEGVELVFATSHANRQGIVYD